MPAAFSLRPREKISHFFFVFSFIFLPAKLLFSNSLFLKICCHATIDVLQIHFYLLFSRCNEFVVHKRLHFFAKLVMAIV